MLSRHIRRRTLRRAPQQHLFCVTTNSVSSRSSLWSPCWQLTQYLSSRAMMLSSRVNPRPWTCTSATARNVTSTIHTMMCTATARRLLKIASMVFLMLISYRGTPTTHAMFVLHRTGRCRAPPRYLSALVAGHFRERKLCFVATET